MFEVIYFHLSLGLEPVGDMSEMKNEVCIFLTLDLLLKY